MSSSKSASTYNKKNWEESEFPIVCETCLGDNSFLRMTKEPHAKECKTCQRPFTIFRWQPGAKARFKKTEICQVCAKTKNVCQTCILDLEFGLPVQVRNQGGATTLTLPHGTINREYNQQQLETLMANSKDVTAHYGGLELSGKTKNSDLLLRMARTEPYYKRNRPHICSFFVKGECRRGEACPFRHERPNDPNDPLSNQNIKDRFHGVNDPVASKIMDNYKKLPSLVPPQDKNILTLYIGNIPETVKEQHLRDYFYQFGLVRTVTLNNRQHCAFVQFATRESAEHAAERSYDKLIMCGQKLSVNWGKSQIEIDTHKSNAMRPVPGLPASMTAIQPPLMTWNMFNNVNGAQIIIPPPPPPPMNTVETATKLSMHYPSQDPNRLGAS